jgi:eukaryotic-like serine/threonine-protein kinase
MSQDYSVGQKLGDYEILGILGAGGMGKVYKVRNTISDRVEAMKILLPDLAGQKDLADRFLREIKVLASLNHPNIAALRTALTLDNQLVMIMEFVDGVTLSSRLHQGAIPPALAIKYIDQVLDALSYAHKQNIIHRDIKPANMMLTPDGTVKLMDFGIARSASDRSLTMTGTTLGSLNYMPPEQVKGDPADNRSDLYSLGVSLYEMVTGQLPFQAESNYAMMAAHLQEVPKPPIVLRPGIPQPLNQIIVMALAKDPGQRFQSADAFRGALKSVPVQGVATQPGADPRAFVPSANAGSATALFQDSPASQSPTTLMETPAYQKTDRIGAATPSRPQTGPLPPTREATPAPPPAVVGSGSHRGLYIALGAFIVVVVLFAAGLYLPRQIKTLAGAGKPAGSTKQPQSTSSSSGPSLTLPPSTSVDPSLPSPAPASPTDPNAPSAGGSTGSTGGSSGGQSPQTGQSSPDGASGSSAGDATGNTTATTGSGGTPAQPARKSSASKPKKNVQASEADAEAKAEEAALAKENEQRYDDIDSRSAAVSQSLDTLQKQQAAAGYGLRGDIVSAQQRMKTDLSKAQSAMQKQDTKNAKKYLDMAEAELSTIEKFLGK